MKYERLHLYYKEKKTVFDNTDIFQTQKQHAYKSLNEF